jgi:hypothetical protein
LRQVRPTVAKHLGYPGHTGTQRFDDRRQAACKEQLEYTTFIMIPQNTCSRMPVLHAHKTRSFVCRCTFSVSWQRSMWGRPGVSFGRSDVTVVSSQLELLPLVSSPNKQPFSACNRLSPFVKASDDFTIKVGHQDRQRITTNSYLVRIMEPAAAGILYAAQDVLSGAAALVKGITHPTQPIRANLRRITSVPLPRSQHTVSIVKGRAYIFGKPEQLQSKPLKLGC